jgi:hypothetical protein
MARKDFRISRMSPILFGFEGSKISFVEENGKLLSAGLRTVGRALARFRVANRDSRKMMEMRAIRRVEMRSLK